MTALRGLDVRLRQTRLFCVTDARLGAGDLASFASGLFDAGVDLIQLRDDAASDTAKLAALKTLQDASRGRRLVSVYADTELAREFGADVLQLPKGGPDAAKARRCVSRWARIGRACYSLPDIDAALAGDGIDFLTVGPIFPRVPWTRGLPGLELVRHAARVAPAFGKGAKPWFAIGGITLANLDAVLAAGARRVAVGAAITTAADPEAAARAFSDRLRQAWASESDTIPPYFG